MAHFSPSVLAVWEDFRDAQLERDLSMLKAQGEIRLEDAEVVTALRRQSIRHHEWMHYRQHVTTMLGAFSYRVAFAKTLLAMRIASKLGDNVPLNRLAVAQPQQRRRLADLGERENVDLWRSVAIIGNVFWKKSVSVGVLRRAVATTFDIFHELPLAQTSEVRIIFEGRDEDLSGPMGTLSVELLSEGLARYREAIVLGEFLGEERGYEFWKSAASRIGEGSISLIQQVVQVPVTHPIVGAFHEVALASCPDVAGNADPARFLEVLPGFRFRKMLATLESGELGFDPARHGIEHAYEIAERAAGWKPGEFTDAYRIHAEKLASDKRMMSVRQLSYWNGSRSRAAIPWAAGFPESSRESLDDSVANYLRPPFIVQPGLTAVNFREASAAGFGWSMFMMIWDLLQNGRSLLVVRRILHNLPSSIRQEFEDELRWYLVHLPPHGIHQRVEGYLFDAT